MEQRGQQVQYGRRRGSGTNEDDDEQPKPKPIETNRNPSYLIFNN
jgi:hypothetical protein